MSLSQMTDQVPSKSDQKLAEWIINWYLQKSATRKKLVPPCSHGLSRFFAGAQFIIWRITMSRHHSCVISSRQALPSKWIWWDSNRYKHYYIDSLRARTMWEPPPGKEQCCNSLIISNYISWAIFPHLESNPLMGTAALPAREIKWSVMITIWLHDFITKHQKSVIEGRHVQPASWKLPRFPSGLDISH